MLCIDGGMRPVIRFIGALLLPLLLSLGGCDTADSPEQRIREMIEAGELAVESGSTTDVMALISNDYRDDKGRGRDQLLQLLGVYFYGHRSIHLLVQVQAIELTGEGRAKATVYAAMAGRPVSDVKSLLALHADLYRFDLNLKELEGAWLVTSSRWRQANPEDFLE